MVKASDVDICIVEDDVLLGQILLSQFQNSGFDTNLITAGDDALTSLTQKTPDLLLLDIFLPGMNGLDVLDRLRKNEGTKDLQVVVVSNTDQIDSRTRAADLGADFVIKASTTPDGIVEMVKKKLNIK